MPHLDLGFSILLEEKENLSNVKELFTYKAYLERVIDGDTLLVNIDLGFSVSIEQLLWLHGLDAPELSTKKG